MRDPSKLLLHRILVAIGSGSVVFSAACGGETLADEPGGSSDAGVDTGSDAVSDAPDNKDVAPDLGADLPPIPMPDGGYPHCVGESTPNTGPCCDNVYCFTPDAATCPPTDEVTQGELGVNAPGSGTCECGRSGPYNSASSEPGVCCYVVGTMGCTGRPLTVEGQIRTSDLTSRPGWVDVDDLFGDESEALVAALQVDSLAPGLRRRLAELWARDAQFEHASVASFNRFSLKLLALAAPAHLVQAAQQAALDEVRHARMCFVLASAYAGRPMAPGPLPLSGDVLGDDDLARLAAETVTEGCIGETVASFEASVALEQARPVAVRKTLAMIADDEARHAELAWAFVRWAMDEGGRPVREAVKAAFDEAMRAPVVVPEQAGRPIDDLLVEQGRLTERGRANVHRQGQREVVLPAMSALFSVRN